MEYNPSSRGLLGPSRWMAGGWGEYPSIAGRVVCGEAHGIQGGDSAPWSLCLSPSTGGYRRWNDGVWGQRDIGKKE